MEILIAIIAFVFGIVIGSFLNVVVLRYHSFSFYKGRSHCFTCNKQLEWFELIPVISYIVLRGHCSKCKSNISPQYILVELGTGFLFMGIVLQYGLSPESMLLLVTVSILMAIFVYDIQHKIIPNGLVYLFIIVALLQNFINFETLSFVLPKTEVLLAGPLLFLPFFIMWDLSKGEWMGLGDAKLALGIGFFLGIKQGITAITISFWIALAVITIFVIVEKIQKKGMFGKRLSRKTEIPFAPFLILSFFIVAFFNFYFYFFDLSLFLV